MRPARRRPQVYDNYYIRVLLGESVLGLPVGRVTRSHRRQAQRVLEQMDLVLISNNETTPSTLQRATGIANFTACREPR